MTIKHILLCFLLSSPGYCGYELIVDGVQPKNSLFRHSAFLRASCWSKKTGSYSWSCGASVVNQRALLTAAHCLHKCNNIELDIKVGSADRYEAKLIRYSHHRVHEKYLDLNLTNDIAIVITREVMEFGRDVKRVALMKNPPKFQIASVAGWGQWVDPERRSLPTYILMAKQKTITNKACEILIGPLPAGTFCTHPVKGYPSVGDSGSALVIRDYIQVGIVSYKKKPQYKVVVYTDAAYFYEWIVKTIKKIYCF